MGYVKGGQYGGDFGQYNSGFYGKKSFAGYKGGNYSGYPEGYAGYGIDMPESAEKGEMGSLKASQIAGRNYQVKPAGLEGADDMSIKRAAFLAQKGYEFGGYGDMNALKASKVLDKTYEKLSPLGGYGDMNALRASKFANKTYDRLSPLGDMDALKASKVVNSTYDDLKRASGVLGSLEQNAFEGLDDVPGYEDAEDPDNVTDNMPSLLGQVPPAADGWAKNFAQANVSLTETGLISALAAGVMGVPDNTSPEVKQQYYTMAMEMMKRRRATNLRHLDLKRAEIQSNIGWLINPSLPKSGGFGASIQRAMGIIGPELAVNDKSYAKMRRLEALGNQLKQSVNKMSNFEGLGQSMMDNKLTWLAAGVLAVGGYCWLRKKK